jgi:hypothetical protein
MKNYTFEIICQDGQPRTFEFRAQDFNQARSMLEQFRTSQPAVGPAPVVQPIPVAGTTDSDNVVRSSGSVSYF